MLNLFSRQPAWLFGGLGLTDPQVPVRLDTSGALSTVDIVQGGWGNGVWAIKQTGSGSVLVQGTPDFTHLVRAVSMNNSTGIAQDVRLYLDFDAALGQSVMLFQQFAVATGVNLPSTLFTFLPLVVPPGAKYALRVEPAAANMNAIASVLTVPAGFKPT